MTKSARWKQEHWMHVAADSVMHRRLTNNKQAILKLSKHSLSLSLCGHHAAFKVGQTLMWYMPIATGYTHWYILLFLWLLISQLSWAYYSQLCPLAWLVLFLPPQWVTVSLPLVYGCVIVCLGQVQWHRLHVGAITHSESRMQMQRHAHSHLAQYS